MLQVNNLDKKLSGTGSFRMIMSHFTYQEATYVV